jgi:hypothetical protein
VIRDINTRGMEDAQAGSITSASVPRPAGRSAAYAGTLWTEMRSLSLRSVCRRARGNHRLVKWKWPAVTQDESGHSKL